MGLSKFILKAANKCLSLLKTNEGRKSSMLGSGTRIGSEGRIINIHGEKPRIKIGENSMVRGEVLTFAHEGRIEIGDWFYMGPGSTIWSSDPQGVKIGNRVLISMNVHIHDTNSHPVDAAERFELTKEIILRGHPKVNPGIKSSPITIGDDVWIGFGVTILKGVTLGEGAIIGAGSTITNDIPPYAIVAGTPAKVIRYAQGHEKVS